MAVAEEGIGGEAPRPQGEVGADGVRATQAIVAIARGVGVVVGGVMEGDDVVG